MTAQLAPELGLEPPGRRTALLTSVGKALVLLDAFDGPGCIVPLRTLSERSGLSKPTAHRLLAVLVDAQYVRRYDTGYALHHHILELGNLVPDCRPRGLRAEAAPLLADLYARTGETVHLAILDGPDIVYLEKIYGHKSARVGTAMGTRRRATCTGLGKAILAFSDHETVVKIVSDYGLTRMTPYSITSERVLKSTLMRIGERGHATDHEESQVGLHCIAAPVLDVRSQQSIAAISISSASSTVTRYSQLLTSTAASLAKLVRIDHPSRVAHGLID